MKTLLRRPSFGSFLFAQAQVAFNDNANKLTLIGCVDPPTVLLATPTFLRQYLKRIPLDAFGTLRRVVSGAEKLPADLHDAFRARFGCEVLEGYGLTEASPVVSFNLPMPARGAGARLAGRQRRTPPARRCPAPARSGNPRGKTSRAARPVRTALRQCRRWQPCRTGSGKVRRWMAHYGRPRPHR